jgi:hypothetical protein
MLMLNETDRNFNNYMKNFLFPYSTNRILTTGKVILQDYPYEVSGLGLDTFGPYDMIRYKCDCGKVCTNQIQYEHRHRSDEYVYYNLYFCYDCLNSKIVNYYKSWNKAPLYRNDYRTLVFESTSPTSDIKLKLPLRLNSEKNNLDLRFKKYAKQIAALQQSKLTTNQPTLTICTSRF